MTTRLAVEPGHQVSRDDILAVLRRHPGLTEEGMTECSFEQRDVVRDWEDWLALSNSVEPVQFTLGWLFRNPRSRGSSYTLKHQMEFETGRYVVNGVMILAAVLAGRGMSWGDHDGCFFNPVVKAVPTQRRRAS